MKEYVVYLTQYTGNNMPQWYIGSSCEDKVLGGYNGSVGSKKYLDVYRHEQINNKELFRTKILSYHSTREEALIEELRLHVMHNVVKNEKYINMSFE